MTTYSHQQALPTVGEFLAAVGVTVTPGNHGIVGVPIISLEVPDGWRKVPEELMPTAYGGVGAAVRTRK